MQLNPTATAPTLFDALPEAVGFALWYRRDRFDKWRCVFTGATSFDCTSAMADSRLPGGQWLTLPCGQHPDR